MTAGGRAVSASVRAVAAKRRLIPQKKAIVLVSVNFKMSQQFIFRDLEISPMKKADDMLQKWRFNVI